MSSFTACQPHAPSFKVLASCSTGLKRTRRTKVFLRALVGESMPVDLPVERRTRIRFFLCFWLFVLSAISFVDRTNISIAGMQLSQQFGLGNQRLGWLASAFLIGYASFQIPAGTLAVRFGPRRIITFGVFIWALCNVLTALIPAGFGQAVVLLVAVRCALGLAEAV